MSFLLDSRANFFGKDPESLYAPTLAKFQGPALYAQNNALFEESDWENLERLMRSSKKDDPLKVGRFGIGFNSVYHMTGELIHREFVLRLRCCISPHCTSVPSVPAVFSTTLHDAHPNCSSFSLLSFNM